MNRRTISILATILILVALLAMLQSGAMAQGPDTDGGGDKAVDSPGSVEPTPVPQEGGDEAEPPVVEPASPDALVSSAFTYQGQLKSGGVPVNGNCDFIWDIYAAAVGGMALATDTDTRMVTGGLFTAVIDVPASLMDGNARYLEIRVRCPAGPGAYTTLTPRQQLYAAPYALGMRLPFSHTISNSGSPIFAVTNNSTATSSPSFLGQSAGGDGVRGISTGAGSADNGVYGETNSPANSEAGVKGVSTSSAAGGYFQSSSGAALYANGDARQALTGDGFVKAGVYVNDCGTTPTLTRFFNNVNASSITVSSGGSAGVCIVDFNFDVSARYIVATSRSLTPRYITFLPGAVADQVTFYKFDANGTAIAGDIMVLVY